MLIFYEDNLLIIVSSIGKLPLEELQACGTVGLDDTYLGMALNQKISSPNRVLVSKSTHANVAVGLPELVS